MNSAKATSAFREAFQDFYTGEAREDTVAGIQQKYHSFNSLKREAKIKAVGDTSLNPFLFDDKSDGIANVYSRWAQQAPAFKDKDEATRNALASKFYDELLGPIYQHAGATPMRKDLWMANAWSQALKYKPEDSYKPSDIQAIMKGVHTLIGEPAKGGRTLVNMMGLAVGSGIDESKHGHQMGFANMALNAVNRVQQAGGVLKAAEETTRVTPFFGGWSKWLKDVGNYNDFWHDVQPDRDFKEKVLSWTAEQAGMLPMYIMAGEVAGGVKGIPLISNLTEATNASKAGKLVAHLLTNGTEGAAFGAMTMESGDGPKEIAKQALNFAAFGTLFHLAGGPAKKLTEFLPGGAERKAMEKAGEIARLGSIGKRFATYEEALNTHHKIIANQLAAGGRPVANSIMEEALSHVRLMEHLYPGGVEDAEHSAYTKALHEKDPVRYGAVFSNAQMIRTWLGNRGLRLTDLTKEQSEELGNWIQEQIQVAGEKINEHVEPVAQQGAAKMASEHINTPDGQEEYQKVLAKYQEQFKNVPDGAKKAEAMAQKEFIEKRQRAMEKQTDAQEVEGIGNAHKMPDGVDSLPPGLRGSKPKYSYGTGNTFDLSFEDPRDLAGYVITGEGKSAAHEDFTEYYTKTHPDMTPVSLRAHGLKLRAMMKERAKNWDGEGKKIIHIPSTYTGEAAPKEMPATITGSRLRRVQRYSHDIRGNVIGYSMSYNFDWDKANFKLAKSQGYKGEKKPNNKFWEDYVNYHFQDNDDYESAVQSFVRDIREHLNPLKRAKLEFEKEGDTDYTNFLGFMYHFRDNLPKPVADKVEEALVNSPKMQGILRSKEVTETQLEHFGQAINNHVAMFMRSKWYLEHGEKNVFRSSQPGLTTKTKWQSDVLMDMQARETKMANQFFPGRSKAMQEAKTRYLRVLESMHTTERGAFNKSEEAVLSASMERTKLLEGIGKKFKAGKEEKLMTDVRELQKQHEEITKRIRSGM